MNGSENKFTIDIPRSAEVMLRFLERENLALRINT